MAYVVPRSPRPRLQTAAELAEIRTRVEERHNENKEWQRDMDKKIDALTVSVQSLLQTRSYTEGAAKIVVILSLCLSAIVGWAASWFHR
jgi:hypothetical protein